MNDFPEFMRNPLNAIDPKLQSPGNVGYVYDGVDGSQMAFWTSTEDVISKEHVHNYDEYFIVVEGEYKLKINNETTILRKGDEYHQHWRTSGANVISKVFRILPLLPLRLRKTERKSDIFPIIIM
jgi:hypothetical protein